MFVSSLGAGTEELAELVVASGLGAGAEELAELVVASGLGAEAESGAGGASGANFGGALGIVGAPSVADLPVLGGRIRYPAGPLLCR